MSDCEHCGHRPEAVPASEMVRASGTIQVSTRLSAGCRVLREQSFLQYVCSALAQQGFEMQEAIPELFRRLSEASGLHSGLLCIVNRETAKLQLEFTEQRPHPTPVRPLVECPLGEGLLGTVASAAQPLLVQDVAATPMEQLGPLDQIALQAPTEALGAKLTAALAVPIRHGDEVLGVLCFQRTNATPAALRTDLDFLSLVAGQVALAVRYRQLARERILTLQHENERLQDQIRRSFIPEGMIGSSSAMRMVYFHIDQVADNKTTVLIRGETGVGKERVAQGIWMGSRRRSAPFVRVNCAALPESIIESELFGHEKGAFTGALALRKGRFELADKGTILLDEIGELSLPMQAKLLRVLQEGTFERVGGTQSLKVDVRVITATNRNLEEMCEQGRFRLDLYYRINVFPIYIPPLRERKSDILELADHFLERCAQRNEKPVLRISTPAIDMLMAYHWPGNVRELENVIERATLLSDDGVIHGYHLPPTLQTGEASGTASSRTLEEAVAAVESEMIIEALKSHRGFMAKAARQLGLTERVMALRVQRYGIDPKRYR